MRSIKDARIAILSEEGFEQEELTSPKYALESAGARVDIISPKQGKIKAWNHTDWGIEVPVDKHMTQPTLPNTMPLCCPAGC